MVFCYSCPKGLRKKFAELLLSPHRNEQNKNPCCSSSYKKNDSIEHILPQGKNVSVDCETNLGESK